MNGKQRVMRPRRGGALLEMFLVLAIVGLLAASAVVWVQWSTDRTRAEMIAAQMNDLRGAAQHYLKANQARIREINSTSALIIPVARTTRLSPIPGGPAGLDSLQGGGFLPDHYIDRNAYGQSHVLAVRVVGSRVEGVVYSHGGQPIPDSDLGGIARTIGIDGGFVAQAPVGGMDDFIVGSGGGWSTRRSLWSGQVNGTTDVAATPGHVMTSLSLMEGQIVTDYVNRYPVTDRPSGNTMAATLFMGSTSASAGNDILGVRDLEAAGTLSAGVDVTVAGQLNAGQDIRSTGTFEAKENLQVEGDARIALDANIAGNLDTAGEMSAGNLGATGGIFADELFNTSAIPPGRSKNRYASRPSGRTDMFDLRPDRLDADAVAFGTSLGIPSIPQVSPETLRLKDLLDNEIFVVQRVGGIGTAIEEAFCPTRSGFRRIGCSGSRMAPLQDNCSEENCGYIGSEPLDRDVMQGCRTVIDPDEGARAVAVAYCMGGTEGGADVAGTPGSSGVGADHCPVWAPGNYPRCIYYGNEGSCPPWAPGTYPNNCVVNTCPVWAPGSYPNCRPIRGNESPADLLPGPQTHHVATLIGHHWDKTLVGTYRNCRTVTLPFGTQPTCTMQNPSGPALAVGGIYRVYNTPNRTYENYVCQSRTTEPYRC